jgi:hypothetical protein
VASAVFAGLTAQLLLPAASAQSAGSVVLVRVPGDERIATRLRAELRSHAWRVVEVRASGDNPSLETLATNRGADAALRARPRQLAVELWTTPQAGAETSGDELIVATGPAADAGMLALRVSEFLRARALGPVITESTGPATSQAAPSTTEPAPSVAPAASDGTAAARATDPNAEQPVQQAPTGAPAAGAAPSAQPPPDAVGGSPVPAATAETEVEPEPDDDADSASDAEATEEDAEIATRFADALLYLEIAPALGLSPGGFAPRFDAWVNLRFQPLATFSFSAFALLPILQGRVRASSGSASVRTLIAGVGADIHLATPNWELSAGLGIAALITWVRHAKAYDVEYEVRDDNLRTPAGVARLGATWRVTNSVHIASRVLVGLSIPKKLAIDFPTDNGMKDSKSWGAPFVTLLLGLEFALPWSR